jgi:hypothetical protein
VKPLPTPEAMLHYIQEKSNAVAWLVVDICAAAHSGKVLGAKKNERKNRY